MSIGEAWLIGKMHTYKEWNECKCSLFSNVSFSVSQRQQLHGIYKLWFKKAAPNRRVLFTIKRFTPSNPNGAKNRSCFFLSWSKVMKSRMVKSTTKCILCTCDHSLFVCNLYSPPSRSWSKCECVCVYCWIMNDRKQIEKKEKTTWVDKTNSRSSSSTSM